MHEHTALSLHGNLAGERVPRHLDHTTQHETFLCMMDMLASGKHQLSRQGAEGDTAVLGGSQGGCVFNQDCLSTRRHILASLKCCGISPSFSSRTQLAQLGNRLQQNRAHHRKSGLFELLKLKSAPPSSRKDVWSQSAKAKAKHGWSEEDSPSEMSGCPAANSAHNRHFKVTTGEHLHPTAESKPKVECHYQQKEGNTHGDIPGSIAASLPNTDRGVLKSPGVSWKPYKNELKLDAEIS